MAVGERYKLNIRGAYAGVVFENRYWYLQVSGVGDAGLLIDAFVEDVIPSLKPVQDSLVIYSEGEAVNQEDPTDFATQTIAAVGNVIGEGLPPFCQWSFKLNTTDSRIRSGGKRIVGIPETLQQDGGASVPALALLATLGTALESLVVDSVSGATFVPILYTPGNIATGGSELEVTMGSATYQVISSQLSRKHT